jgi:hypothetical protein
MIKKIDNGIVETDKSGVIMFDLLNINKSFRFDGYPIRNILTQY